MQLNLCQSEIEQAIRDHLQKMGINRTVSSMDFIVSRKGKSNVNVDIDFLALDAKETSSDEGETVTPKVEVISTEAEAANEDAGEPDDTGSPVEDNLFATTS